MGFGRIVHTRIDCEADSRSRCQALKDILIELEERIDHLVNEEGVFAGNLPTDVKIMTEDGDKKPSDLLKGMTSVDEDASLTFVASQDDAWVSAGVSGVLESGRAYTCAAATPDGKFYMGLRNKPADPDGLLELYEIVDDVVGARLSQTESSTFRTAIGNGAVMHPTGRYLATINTDAADGLQKLVITDLEDPTAPVIVGTLVLTAAPAAATQGLWDAARGVIYWPGKSGTNHVFVYDVSDPGNPLLASTYTTSGLTNCIAAVLSPNREFLYLAGNGGVESASIAADGTLTKDTTILLGGLWETLDHNGTSLATLKWASNAVINVLTIDIDDADEGTISTNTNNSVTGSYAEAAEMRNCSYVGNYLACPSGMEGVLSTEGLFLVFDLRNLDSVTEFSSTVPSTLDVTSVVAMGGPKNRKYVQLGVDADVQTWKVAEVAGGVDLSLETIRVTNLVVGSSEMVRGLNAEFLNGLPGPAYLLVGDGVEGPATSTDNAVPRFDGVTGSLLQDSGVTIDDSDNLDVPGSLTLGTVLAEAEGGTGVAALSSIDHGVFAGLLDNDHTQYPLISGTPADGQLVLWAGAQSQDGTSDLTFNGVTVLVTGNSFSGITATTANDSASIRPLAQFRKARGSGGSETATQAGDFLGSFLWNGHNGSAYTANNPGTVDARATENFTGSATGTRVLFAATPNGSTTRATVVSFLGTGAHLLVGTGATSPTGGTTAVLMEQGAALSGMPSNTGAVQVKDVGGTAEVFAVNESAGATQISSHPADHAYDPAERYPWAFRASQPHLGVDVTCEMSRVVRVVEQLAALAGIPEDLILYRDLPGTPSDWHADQRRNAEQAMADYERHEARAAEHASREADHADAVTAWEALPSAEDTRRAEWEALPKDRNGERYRLAEARDDSGNKVRVRVAAPEPPLRELRRESVEMVADDGTRVRVPHLRERPPAPEPLQEAPPPLPVVKEPPDMILRQLIDLDRWDKAAHDALVAEVEEWKATR